MTRYIGMYRRSLLRGQSIGSDLEVRVLAARLLVADDCAEGKHRTETTDEGDEECRFCGIVFDGTYPTKVLRSGWSQDDHP